MVKRKGIGYTLEAIVAILTVIVFTAGAFQSTQPFEWDGFQRETTAKDLGYVLKETGNLGNFSKRAESGSIRTAVSTLTDQRMEASGTINNLPVGEKKIGFYTAIDRRQKQSSRELLDECGGNLGELPSEYAIKRSWQGVAGGDDDLEQKNGDIRVYITDSDPQISGGFNGEEDYDSLWVDNGTECQFTASEGPYHQGEFFKWGPTHYDIDRIFNDGERFDVFIANQTVRFRNTMRAQVNGITTDTTFDTFTLSGDMEYDTAVFRRQKTLDDINSNNDLKTNFYDYLDQGSVLFLVDLSETDFDSGIIDDSGMKWKEPDSFTPIGYTRGITDVSFPQKESSQDIETYFKGMGGKEDDPSLQPEGKVISDGILYAGTGKYDNKDWDAANFSMDPLPEAEAPPGTPSSDCASPDYRNGTFMFPDVERKAVSIPLESCNGRWGIALDKDGDGVFESSQEAESNEKIFVDGDEIMIEGEKYTLNYYTSGGCSPGECFAFNYSGEERVEIVNYVNRFEDRDIGHFARASYEDEYSEQDRVLLSSVIYQLAGDNYAFGSDQPSEISTSVLGSVKNDIYMPYTVNLRWRR